MNEKFDLDALAVISVVHYLEDKFPELGLLDKLTGENYEEMSDIIYAVYLDEEDDEEDDVFEPDEWYFEDNLDYDN